MSANISELVKDAQFSSYADLFETIQNYQKKHNVIMSRAKSRLINPANRDGVNEELVYIEISYKCKKAGIFKSKGRGLRKVNSSKTNCPAFIDVRVPKNKQYLKIANICLTHNHDMPEIGQTNELDTKDSTELEVVKQTGMTDLIPDNIPISPTEETAGRVTPSKECASMDLSMPYQVTMAELLGITYSERLHECETDLADTDNINEEKNLSASMKNLSVNENERQYLEDVKVSTITKTLKHNDGKEASPQPSVSPNTPESFKIENVYSNCATMDVSSSQRAVSVVNLDDICMPTVNSKGRPRGRELLAIGLPIKKKKAVNFTAQRPLIQAKMLLQWVVTEDSTINNTLTGEYLIREKDIPPHEQELPESLMADEVDLSVLVQYLEKPAFLKLKKLVHQKKSLGIWTCRTCRGQLAERSIFCDSCLCWYDYKCVGLKQAPKAKRWYCSGCTC